MHFLPCPSGGPHLLLSSILLYFKFEFRFQNDDLGKPDKHFRVPFRSDFQGCEYKSCVICWVPKWGQHPDVNFSKSAMRALGRRPGASAIRALGYFKDPLERVLCGNCDAVMMGPPCSESALAAGSDGGQQPVDSTTKPPSAQSPRSPAAREQQPLRLPRPAERRRLGR
jgi:hypothetical protein